MEIERKEILPGVFLSVLQTGKFKSDCLSVSFLTALDRETVSRNSLLPRVLLRGTERYPDMDALNAACDALYGARIVPAVRKRGEILAVGFYAGFIADRFTPDGSALLEPAVALLGEVLLSPATRNGLLRTDYVESEKEKLIDDIRAVVNDKRGYAAKRLIEQMFACEAYGCDDMGMEADAAAIDPAELTRHYHRLLETSPVEIFYCGGADASRVASALRDTLSALPRGEIDWELGTDVRMNALEAEPRYFDEALEVGQSKLCLGFRLGESMENPDFAALRVFNALYGGSVNSRLFLNVREKLSLCYYASSALDRMKGALFVFSGIEQENCKTAKDEILAQLEDIARGAITAEELRAAQKAAAGELRASTDSPGALEAFYLTQTLLGLDDGPEAVAALCEEVTAEDVAAVARNAELDTVYLLHGNGALPSANDTDGEGERSTQADDEA